MPIKKAAFKSLWQSQKRQLRNKKIKSDIEAVVKRVRQAVRAKDINKAQEWFKQTVKKFDKAAQGGVIKKNIARRNKSRLAKAIRVLAGK